MSREFDSRVELRHAGLVDLDGVSIPQETEELDLRDNALKGLEGATELPQLTALYAGRNILSRLRPTPLAALSRLEVLDLSDNRLEGVDLEGLTALRFLNLAGNRLQEAGAIVGLQEGCRLCGLDLSRNLVATSNQNSRPFHRLLTLLKHLQLLSLLGNPACLSPGEAAEILPQLLVYNARLVVRRESQGATFGESLPRRAGFRWASAGRSTASLPEGVHAAAGGEGLTVGGEALETRPSMTRRGPAPVLDSADDMTNPSGRGSQSSVSEFGGGYEGAREGDCSDPSQTPHLVGVVERQDSANYQPRPPALAERQDSAQNLQAMEEDVAALATPSGPSVEHAQPGMARQDSARELDESARSPSPTGGNTSPARAQEAGAPSPFMTTPASPERNTFRRTSGNDLHISVRRDSASERLSARVSGSGVEDMDRSPHQEPAQDPLLNLRVSRPTSELGEPSLSRRSSLQAARQVLRSLSSTPRPDFPPTSSTPSSSHDDLRPIRQDSALDSLSEARGAVLSQLQTPGLPPVSSTDPLQQARRLIQETSGSPLPLRPPQPLSPLLQARQSLAGPNSPFEAPSLPLTPLSPAWTASQIHPSFPHRLPSINSGVSWTLSGNSSDFTGTSCREDEGSLLAEARRVVLGEPNPPTRPHAHFHTDSAGPSSSGEDAGAVATSQGS